MTKSFFGQDQPSLPLIMGVINLSPDSFYPDSRIDGIKDAVLFAEKMVVEGAGILDIGAESSRPGAKPVDDREELARLLPVVKELVGHFSIPVSVDTYKPNVAEQVLDAGARIINDITGLKRFHKTADLVARYDAGVILMHMKGTPETMQENPHYGDVTTEIIDSLSKSVAVAESAGISSEKIAIDPGIGFGKTVSNNFEIIRKIEYFTSLGKPVVLGASRKSFIGSLHDLGVHDRLAGSLSVAVTAYIKGARVFRVHDVRETVHALTLARAILEDQEI